MEHSATNVVLHAIIPCESLYNLGFHEMNFREWSFSKRFREINFCERDHSSRNSLQGDQANTILFKNRCHFIETFSFLDFTA